MRVGLISVDSHNFPNLPLMKLSAWQSSKEIPWNVTYRYNMDSQIRRLIGRICQRYSVSRRIIGIL